MANTDNNPHGQAIRAQGRFLAGSIFSPVLRFAAGCVLALAAILLFTLIALRAQLLANMQVQALDDAGAISLALQPHIESKDTPTRDTLLTAMLQSGGYSEITLVDLDGRTLFQQQAPRTVVDVPEWFQQLVSIRAPIARVEVLAGWDIAGILALSRHPAAAYRVLWRAALGIAGTGLIALALALWLRRRQWQARVRKAEAQRAQVKALQKRIYQLTVVVEELKKSTHDENVSAIEDDD